MTGRTTWWPKDAAWHRRDRVVELGAEHGPVGLVVLDVLCAWAQEQRSSGVVKGGYLALAREAFVTAQDARTVVAHAAEIGALDDLDRSPDERMFTCRISGWESDQERGRAAIKKADQRAASDGDSSPVEGTSRPVVPTEGDMSGSVPLPNQTKPNKQQTTTSGELDKATPESLGFSQLLADLILQRDPKAKVAPQSDKWLASMRLLLADRNQDVAEVGRVLRWSQSDSFWQAHILTPSKLREKYPTLVLRAGVAPLQAVAGSGANRPAWPQDDEVAALVRDIFPPAVDGDRARQAVLAAWGMGHREPPAILEWAAKTDPELLEPAA